MGENCEGPLMTDSRLSEQKKSHPAGWLLDITCNTYKVAFSMLEEFEHDLHKHIHLENNILFPKAIVLEHSFSN